MTKKLSNEEFLQKLNSVTKNIVLIDLYDGSHKKIRVKYLDCGHTELKEPARLLIGQGCGHKECKSKRISKNKISNKKNQQILKIESLGYTVNSEYNGLRNKINVTNLQCGHTYFSQAGNIITGRGCPVCYGYKDTKKFIDILNAKYPNEYDVLGEYINNREKISITHNLCNTTWDVMPKDLLRSRMCPKCCKSKGEIFVQEILEKNDIKYIAQYRFKDCIYKRELPFDFAIFLNNEIRLIEFDGSQHFKSGSNFWGNPDSYHTTRIRDEIKNDYCVKKNIKLLRIPYWWIRNNKAEKEILNFISTPTTIETN